MKAVSANFDFLGKHDAQLVRLGALAERYFKEDPNTCLIKLRQFGEVLAQLTAAKAGLLASPEEPQADLLRRLKFERIVPREVGELFHQLRIAGNRATHAQADDHAEALSMLKIARQLGIWFQRTFGQAVFSAGPFVPPPDPADATKALQEELARLRIVLDQTRSEADKARIAVEAEARERVSAQERARKEAEERSVWEQLASEAEKAKAALASELQAIQTVGAQATAQTTAAIVAKAEAAASDIDIDEAATRTTACDPPVTGKCFVRGRRSTHSYRELFRCHILGAKLFSKFGHTTPCRSIPIVPIDNAAGTHYCLTPGWNMLLFTAHSGESVYDFQT